MANITLSKGAAPATPTSGQALIYINTSGTPRTINDNGVDSAFGISDAPSDGTTYGRNNAAWVNAGGGLPPNYLVGLGLSNSVLSSTQGITSASGTCRSIDNTADLALLAPITKIITGSWAVGNGSGGLDIGLASGTASYHMFLIKRSDIGVVDMLFSLSPTSPTMPANYDQKRRIGSIMRESGAIVAFIQNDDTFIRNVPKNSLASTNPGTAAITVTLNIPTGLIAEAILGVRGYAGTTADHLSFVYLSDLATADTTPSANCFSFVEYVQLVGDVTLGITTRVFTNTSSQIRVRCSTSGATSILTINTLGWVDTRGRLS